MNGKYTLKSFIKVFMSDVLYLYPFWEIWNLRRQQSRAYLL